VAVLSAGTGAVLAAVSVTTLDVALDGVVAGDFLAVEDLLADFLAVDFLGVDFLAVDFLAVDFFAVEVEDDVDALDGAFVAAELFLAVDFLAVDFLVSDFFAVDRLAGDFVPDVLVLEVVLVSAIDCPPCGPTGRRIADRRTLARRRVLSRIVPVVT
jgi:hypothetical protein